MSPRSLTISSLHNPRVKQAVKLRKRSAREELDLLLVEGYRELRRALDNDWCPTGLFYCPEFFLGDNETALVEECGRRQVELLECSQEVFQKIAYRERPEGLLAVGPAWRLELKDLKLSDTPLVVIAEAIEKPGNLGTMLRSADAAGVDAVIVCDRCTDLLNPNVVRSSIGTLFSVPTVEAGSDETINWLRSHNIQIVAATPQGPDTYWDAHLVRSTALVMGTEQYGLSEQWMQEADVQVSIPMLGQADSLNVAAATTILLFEAVRQRQASS